VVSNDGFNQAAAWQSLIVVPLSTSGLQARRGPTIIEIPAGAAGLAKTSVAICHQVTTLDRAKLSKRIGLLSANLADAVNEALKAALDLD
jgi:mRNA interferase MazF